jgi:1-acyl-sn-glycerol-3-phosphate acyltransferase
MPRFGVSGVPARATASGTAPLPRCSPLLFRAFAGYLPGYFARRFNAVRIASGGLPQHHGGRPVIIYSNHPSWWDPALYVLLCARLFPAHRGFGPMDADALRKYPILERIGVFGIESETFAGAMRFLTICEQLLADSRHIVWITAQGEFADARKRPVILRPGLAHLARRVPHAIVYPLALEYPFWNESRPEALCCFGDPIDLRVAGDRTPAQWTAYFHRALTQTMDRLAADSMQRDPGRFHLLTRGGNGVGGLYDLGRRLRAVLRRRRFDPSHGGTE